ncbi:hypothetical protein [Rhizobium leguminosarum]|uniref:hypothetical protein n=1 Tax=Rhizobium leguminosarum TaxID=384 RepID=UPI0013BC7BE1|nr:hypothetical protein [Rhizobium leguminosarum]MBY5324431.1 hypothetical protein [Rhizobium leguminosarum]MCA2436025.1 hypothetical protein [Rhizobium leguminosarum]NEH74035.1 hypothetical protein [Rhizobium leguminosarum]
MIKAVTFFVIYEIEKAQLAALMYDRPQLAEELGRVSHDRVSSLHHLSIASKDGPGNDSQSSAERVRHIFGVSV